MSVYRNNIQLPQTTASANQGLAISSHEFVLLGGMAIGGIGLVFAGMTWAGLGLIGLAGIILTIIRPEWGVVAVFSFQAWDQILTPSSESGMSSFSLGRILVCLIILIYFIRVFPFQRPIFLCCTKQYRNRFCNSNLGHNIYSLVI